MFVMENAPLGSWLPCIISLGGFSSPACVVVVGVCN